MKMPMRMPIRMMIACALALAGSNAALALEGVGQVNGTVLAKDRKAAPGLTVAAFGTSGNVYGTCTDEYGRYAFRGLQADTYTIVVSVPAEGVVRKEGIRVRPLFRSIVDFTVAEDSST